MRINFDFPTKQIQITYGILLNPGVNEVPDEIGEDLIKGSDSLIVSIAKKTKKTEAEVRKAREGKGIFTKIEELPVDSAIKKKGRGN